MVNESKYEFITSNCNVKRFIEISYFYYTVPEILIAHSTFCDIPKDISPVLVLLGAILPFSKPVRIISKDIKPEGYVCRNR